MKPVSGGKPPNDSMVAMVSVVRIGAFVHPVASVLIFVAVVIFSAMKADDVMMI